MKTKEKNNIIIVRLFPEENILSSLKHIAQKHRIQTAIILSGIGQIENPTLGYFREKNNYMPNTFTGIYELLTVSGTIIHSDDQYHIHIHVTIGDEDKNVLGGHLIDGTVSVTNEISLIKTTLSTTKTLSKKTGLMELTL